MVFKAWGPRHFLAPAVHINAAFNISFVTLRKLLLGDAMWALPVLEQKFFAL